jgi:hypothetical protein
MERETGHAVLQDGSPRSGAERGLLARETRGGNARRGEIAVQESAARELAAQAAARLTVA